MESDEIHSLSSSSEEDESHSTAPEIDPTMKTKKVAPQQERNTRRQRLVQSSSSSSSSKNSSFLPSDLWPGLNWRGRLEILWEIDKVHYWWPCTLLQKTSYNDVQCIKIQYDPFVRGGFLEPTLGHILFVSDINIRELSEGLLLHWKRPGEQRKILPAKVSRSILRDKQEHEDIQEEQKRRRRKRL